MSIIMLLIYLFCGLALTYILCEIAPGGAKNNFTWRNQGWIWIIVGTVAWPVFAILLLLKR